MNVLEQTHVETPFLDQLSTMGWRINTGNPDDPGASARTSFREVFLEHDLRAALHRINLDPSGNPWLDDARISQAVSALTRIAASSLIEANAAATRLLLDGIDVEGRPDWDGGRSQRIRYIDFDTPTANTFRAISQFRVELPGAIKSKAIVPDIVLFVNGIPLVVVECKSPKIAAPLEEAIDQLLRYSNQIDGIAGIEALFRTNVLLVATCSDEARVATVCARAVHYAAWKDTSPEPTATVEKQLGVKKLSAQQTLVAGMLRPAHLLDLLRTFSLFLTEGGRMYRVVARYQQFRAVHLALHRLKTGKIRTQTRDDRDKRGGIIWHTQGSGKSLTMMFLVRAMRCDPELRKFKIVFVTDRKDLQAQLAATAEHAGEPVKKATKSEHLRTMLAPKGPALVFAMIQKYRDRDLDDVADASAPADPDVDLDVVNDDASILVIVDEAHRSHANALHANLEAALPNAATIGFTGTPIVMGQQKRTREIFGDYIDKYTLRQSEEDGTTVPIVYEGRTADAAVADGRNLDELFEDMLRDRTPEELEAIKRKYATRGDVIAAPKLIEAKAEDILEHYVEHVLPNGFKAQLVAVTRKAAVLYRTKLIVARDRMVADVDALDAKILAMDEAEATELPRRQRVLRVAARHRDLVAALDFAPVISGSPKDEDALAQWTDRDQIDARIAQFKKPLGTGDPKRSPLAFLIVKSMLLTGFDAPVEQVLYLDRAIKEAELLQAIARVNRTHGEKKRVGLVVDYYGVARHLKDALDAYEQDDVDGVMHSMKDELPKLRDQHARLLAMFAEREILVSGVLSRREREAIATQFRGWQHPEIADRDRGANLGDGSHAAALRAVVALERFLLVPSTSSGKDVYAQLHPRFVQAVRKILDPRTSPIDRDVYTQQLVLLVEPMCFKMLAMLEPTTFASLAKKKKGLDTGLVALSGAGRSRYNLQLSPAEFERVEGWSDRTSYEYAVRDVVPFRLDVAHRATEVPTGLWRSTLAVMLGLADANLADFEKYPAPDTTEAQSDVEALAALRDDRLRAQMHVELSGFLSTLDTVLPRAEARPFLEDAKHFSALHERARRLYRGGERPIGREVGEKVRALIDEHVISLGIDPKVPPIEILDAKFDAHIGRVPSARAKASEMEHALRHHIRMHEGEDPVLYKKLSERLEEILAANEERWEDIVEQLGPLFQAVRGGREADDSGLDPQTEAPFFDVMRVRVVVPLDAATTETLREVTVEIVAHAKSELRLKGFWEHPAAMAALRGWFFDKLDDSRLFEFDECSRLAGELVELARNNHGRLVP